VVVAVISDTHLPRGTRRIPDACVAAMRAADLIVDADGAKIAIVHDAGPARARLERLRARFPGADAVVFGHSHIPLHEARDGFQIFNPGSPTDKRREPRFTMGRAEVEGGRVRFAIVPLD
jgi:predicted phosphodiesterase